MNEQNERLEVMKRRCRTSSKVVGIIQIVTIVGIVLSLVGAIYCFTQKDMINDHLASAVESGQVTVENLRIGSGVFHFMIDYTQAFKEGMYAVPMGFNCVFSAVMCLIITCALGLFKDIFKDLSGEAMPFSEKILGKLKYAFIMLIAALLVFVGIGPAVVGALLMWCIYSILEYGKALQTEIDETL